MAYKDIKSKRYLLALKARLARANESPEKRAVRLEKAKLYQREWRKLNSNRESIKEAKYRYKKTSKGRATNSKHLMARRTGMRQATPIWADMNDIGDVYMEAAYMQMQVDHIVPLRNPLVCGLHVWDNLQIMDGLKNNRKGNRFWPDMPA
jgi:5-methylcytosine-specific restriction endonuclease McrA